MSAIELHQETRRVLKERSILRDLPDAALDSLCTRAHRRALAKGETLYQRGDAGDDMTIVLSGRLKIRNVTVDGREIVLNFIRAGEVTGEIAALDGGQRTADAVALEPAVCACLPRREVLAALKANPDVLLRLVAVLCERVRASSAIVEDATLQLAGRAAAGLLRLSERHGRKVGFGVLIDLSLAQRDLAAYLGMSRENANRQLGILRDEGLITVEDNQIILLDLEGLQRIVDAGADPF
jgi:CRP-like cAMP-binding protein